MMIDKKWIRKGGITTHKLVIIVVGIGVVAVTMMTLKGAIEGAYTQGLKTALEK